MWKNEYIWQFFFQITSTVFRYCKFQWFYRKNYIRIYHSTTSFYSKKYSKLIEKIDKSDCLPGSVARGLPLPWRWWLDARKTCAPSPPQPSRCHRGCCRQICRHGSPPPYRKPLFRSMFHSSRQNWRMSNSIWGLQLWNVSCWVYWRVPYQLLLVNRKILSHYKVLSYCDCNLQLHYTYCYYPEVLWKVQMYFWLK